MIWANFRPKEEWGIYARAVVDTCIYGSEECDHEESAAIAQFLAIFNGDWRNWSAGGLKHYCKMGCICGGIPLHQLRIMAKVLFAKVVLGRKPQVPALSRWLRCRTTAQWFFLAFSVHGIYLHGSLVLYKLKGTQKQSLQKECARLQQNLSALVQTRPGNNNVESTAAGAFMLPDLPVCQIVRVRARKSADWVTNPSSPLNLAISLDATKPATHFSHWLFAQQRDILMQVWRTFSF